MIKLYEANETQFNHNGHILTNCIECTITEESNGVFNAEFIFPFSPEFETGMIITADTPRGEQYFRIVKPRVIYNRNEKRTKFLARHIFYDLSNNFIENIRPTDKGADAFLRAILEGTAIPHRFTSKTLDIQGIKTANYVRKNPIECIIGNNSNSFINLFGGDIERDNFNILIQGGTRDNGYKIEAGKNLVGIEIETNMDNVATRLYPTIVMDQNKVINLPEKYVDSPLLNKYPEPIISEYRINLTETEQIKPMDELYELMRVRAREKFSVEHTDEPEVNYKVDFVLLEKTEQYKLINILKKLNLNDVASINVPSLGIDIKAKFIKYRWDGIAKRYLAAELGNFKKMLTDQSRALKEAVKILIKENNDGEITAKLKEALDKIIGNTGGYQKIIYNSDGLPQGTIWMDTPDVYTTKNYILVNNNGIAFGNQGLAVPPTGAIGIDGTVTADTGFFRSIYTNLIKSEFGKELDLSSNAGINLIVQDIFEKIRTIELTPGPQGIQGPPGADGESLYTWVRWADSPTTGMSGNPLNKTYMGIAENKTAITPSANYSDYTWVLVKGNDGTNGIAGKDGVGIKNTTISYGTSESGTKQPASWLASVPSVPKGKYLWTKTVWNYTDNTAEEGYNVTYMGTDGNNGIDGIAGKDGVGITDTVITYAVSANGTTPPTAGYTINVPTVPQGEYLWTKTVWNYTDNTTEIGYSVARMGTDGIKGKDSYIWIKYADSPTTGMSDDPTGKKYLGLATNKETPIESSNYSDYTWSLLYDETLIAKTVEEKTADLKILLDKISSTVQEKIKSNAIVPKDGRIVLSAPIKYYGTAENAKSKIDNLGIKDAGTYYVTEEKNGMYKITMDISQPGFWINPTEGIGPLQTISERMSLLEQLVTSITMEFKDKLNNTKYVFDGAAAKFYGADFLIYDKQGNLIFGFDGESLTLTVSDGEVSTKMLPNGFFVESTVNGTLLTAVDTNGFRADSAYFQHVSSPDITRRLAKKLDIYINDIALGDGSGRNEENASSNFNNAWIRLTGNAEFISYVTINIIFVGKLWVDNINLICKGGGGTINIYSKYKDAIFIGKMKFYNVRSSINLNGENFLYLSAPPVVSEPKEDTETENEEFAFCIVHESSVFIDKCKIISNSRYGIYADKGSVIKLTNCDIYGPKIGAQSTNGSSVTLRDCRGTATQYSGVAFNGARIAALGNTIAVKSIETSAPKEGTATVIRKGNLVTITANTPMHMTADEAKNGTNPVAQFDPGDYFIFNEAYGMINITKTEGVPGGWINPNYKTTGTGTGTTTKPLVEVNSDRTSATVNGDIKGYGTAGDAQNDTNQVTTWSAGTYSIFTESGGMINITKSPGTPGIWINPKGSITTTDPGTSQPPTPSGGEFGHATRMVNFLRSKVGMSGAPAWNWLFGYWVEWCATFVSWAGYQMGYTSRGWKKDGWVPNWAAAATTSGSTWRRFYGYNERPKPGDIFITPTEGHIGFVGWVPETGNIFYSVEGNSQSTQYVTKQERAISGGSVGFFIRPNYQYFEGK